MFAVMLSESEVAFGRATGVARYEMQRRSDRADGRAIRGVASPALDVLGALAELAFAKRMGLEWTGRFEDDPEKWLTWSKTARDVGLFEVRAVAGPQRRLILHREDKDDAPFVLVRAHRCPMFELAGWFLGRDGKREEWWEQGEHNAPCFYVPNARLRQMSDLADVLKSQG